MCLSYVVVDGLVCQRVGNSGQPNSDRMSPVYLVQEANIARKRKAASPVKDGPDAKRQVPIENGCDTATKTPQVRNSLA